MKDGVGKLRWCIGIWKNTVRIAETVQMIRRDVWETNTEQLQGGRRKSRGKGNMICSRPREREG